MISQAFSAMLVLMGELESLIQSTCFSAGTQMGQSLGGELLLGLVQGPRVRSV